jgi:outer membrane protein assembly factor BamB
MQGNRQGFLYALDPATKQIRWKHRVNRPSQYNDPAVWPTSCFALGEGAVYYENYGFVAKVKR